VSDGWAKCAEELELSSSHRPDLKEIGTSVLSFSSLTLCACLSTCFFKKSKLKVRGNCYVTSDYGFGVSTSSDVKIIQIPHLPLPLKFSPFTHIQIYMERNFLYVCTIISRILQSIWQHVHSLFQTVFSA
jgi:hypothetical protein